jgi:hypothetical protein
LGFLGIDVEDKFLASPNLPDSNRTRIQEAVDECNNQHLQPVIYSNASYWGKILPQNDHSWSSLPLWETNPNGTNKDDLCSPLPIPTFGGWAGRDGKQYQLDTWAGLTFVSGSGMHIPSAIKVDRDVFTANAFKAYNPEFVPVAYQRLEVTTSLTRQTPGGPVVANVTVYNPNNIGTHITIDNTKLRRPTLGGIPASDIGMPSSEVPAGQVFVPSHSTSGPIPITFAGAQSGNTVLHIPVKDAANGIPLNIKVVVP